jgi:hypothetical protein
MLRAGRCGASWRRGEPTPWLLRCTCRDSVEEEFSHGVIPKRPLIRCEFEHGAMSARMGCKTCTHWNRRGDRCSNGMQNMHTLE